MATAPTVDDLFPSGTAPAAAPTAAEIEAASKPAFYPSVGRGDGLSGAPAKAATVEDLFPSGAPPANASEMAKAAGMGTVKGALRDPPIAAGAMTGFRLGMPMATAAAPFIGPFAGAIPLFTTALGGYLGYEAGQAASSLVPQETDPRLKPYFEGGTTFGSALATSPAAFFLPVKGPTAGRVATFLSNMGTSARSSPKAFLATEAATAGTMGVAGGTAEAYRPGQEGVRFGAELTAGLLPVNKLLFAGVTTAKTGLSAIKSGYAGRSNAQEKKAANLILDALEKHGEDPEALIKALRQQVPSSVPTPTSGQKTGSQALMDLEASLGNHRVEFGGETAKQGQLALKAYQELVDSLQRVGDPQALRLAADLTKQRFDNMLETRLSLADANAARKIARISSDTPAARRQIGSIVKFETEQALNQARDVESQIWNAALEGMTKPVKTTIQRKVQTDWDRFRDRPVFKTYNEPVIRTPTLVPTATADSFLKRASEMGPALFDDIPPQVRKIMDSFGISEDSVKQFRQGKLTDAYLDTGKIPDSFMPRIKDQPIQDLVSYRSTLLKMARDAAGEGKNSNADFYSSLADGMMRDLDTLKDPMYDQARAFSRSLNDTFTRTYAKAVSAVDKTGKDRLSPETLVQTAFGGGADQTAMRMREIEDAVGFIRTQYRDIVAQFGKDSPQALQLKPLAVAATGNVASVRDAHNRILRLAAAEAVEVVPGKEPGTFVQKLNFGKLTKFAQQNAPLLEKMGIMGDLRDAAHASNLLTQVTKQNSALVKAANDQAAFAKLLTAESPTTVIADGLNGRYPVKSINNLMDLAKKSGPDAVNGLKSSLYDYAYTQAGGMSQTGKFSPNAYASALFDPIARNQPSLVNIMRSNGMMTLQEVVNLRKLINPMVRIETALKNNIPFEDVIQGADAVTELALRVAGAEVGKVGAQTLGGSGNSLIAASAGSKAVRQIFDSLPNATIRTIMENAIKDPEAMALLMQKGRTEKEKMDIANGLINFLGTFGVSVGKSAVTPSLNYLSAEEQKPAQTSPLTPQGQAARQLRQMPPAPSTRGVPGLGKPGAPPSAPSGPQSSGPPTNANARSMYASLFPFDTVSPMAAAQPAQQ